jgi:lantibiotic leader peptide-processing serine protease
VGHAADRRHPNGSYRVNQGSRQVLVGIIDTGIDGSHPDLRANFNRRLSRNFTTDIPLIDGACEHPSCVDPADEDDNGHGSHTAGTVAAAVNGLGIAGVAPR